MRASRRLFLTLLGLSQVADAGSGAAAVEFFPGTLPASGQSGVAAFPGAGPVSQGTGSDGAVEDPLTLSSREVLDAMSRRLQSVADELEANGYRSIALIDDLASLAALYQELGDHFPAIGALDWALEISRIRKGLHSLDHAALLEQMIASRTALKDYGGAASLEERLLELVERNRDDPRVTLILSASADRRMRETYRVLEEGTGEQPSGRLTPARRAEARAALRVARRQYAEAIALAVENGGYAMLDLLELEQQLLSTLFLEMSHPELAPSSGQNQWLCAAGEEVLKISLGTVSQFSPVPGAAAEAMVRLADWRLLCSSNGSALDTYESAYESLLEEGAAAGSVVDLLSPDVPAVLPAFPDPLEADAEPHGYRGYVDVSFVVGRYGTTRQIEILNRSTGTTKAVEKELKAHIAGNRFRPRFVDGELARADRVAVRYYYR